MNRTATWERTGGKTWRVSFNRGPVLSPLGEWKRDGGMDAYLGRFHGSGGRQAIGRLSCFRDAPTLRSEKTVIAGVEV